MASQDVKQAAQAAVAASARAAASAPRSSSPAPGNHGSWDDDEEEKRRQQQQEEQKQEEKKEEKKEEESKSVLDIITGGPAQEPSALQQAVGDVTGQNGRGVNSYARGDYLAGQQQQAQMPQGWDPKQVLDIMAYGTGSVYSSANPVNQAIDTYNRIEEAYNQAEAEYNKTQDALKTALQNAPGDIDYETDPTISAARAAAKKAEDDLRIARDAYEQAGGIGHSYSMEDRASDIVKGAAGSTAASDVDAVRAIWEKGGNQREMRRAEEEATLADLDASVQRAQIRLDDLMRTTGGDTSNPVVQQAMERLRQEQDFRNRYVNASGGAFNVDRLNAVTGKAQAIADRLAGASAQDIERAKEGLNGFERMLVDAGVSGTQMAMDAAVSAMTGGLISPEAAMAMRSFGGGTMQARQGGGDIDQQLMYGGATAVLEVLTEKMFDGLAGIYGKGAADEVVEEVIGKMAKTDAGRTALRTLFSAGGEAAEELVSGAANPALQSIYNGQSIGQNYSETDAKDILYDALVGGLIGFVGGAGSITTGQNAAKNAELRANEARAQQAQTPQTTGIPALDVIQNGEVQQTAPEAQAPAPEVETPAAEPASPAAEEMQNPVMEVIQNGEVQAPAGTRSEEIDRRINEITQQLEALDAQYESDPASVDRNEFIRLGQEAVQLENEKKQIAAQDEARKTQQGRIDAGDVSKGFGTAENHIDNRTNSGVANRNVKAFQFDHPELHQYFADIAQELMMETEAAEVNAAARGHKQGSVIQGPVKTLMQLGLTKPRIMKCLNDIIQNNGVENYADAKRVEIVLNDMLTNGWTGRMRRSNDVHEPNADYIAAKDAIDGGIKSGSWEKYLDDHYFEIMDGLVTEEGLRAEWEALHPETQQAQEAPAPAPVTEQAVETEQPAPQTQQTVQQTSGTDERGYTGPLVDTQDRVFETNLTEEEKQIEGLTPEEAMHIRHSDVEVDKRAKARLENVELARTELLNAESWTDEDTATAGYLIQQELAAADNAQTEAERTEIYKRLAELKKQWNKQGTEEGRALRQRSRFVSEDMVATAADILYGKEKDSTDQKALRRLSPQAKDGIMRNVRQFANQYNNIQKNGGNVNDVIALIKAVSEARRTTGLFSRQNGRAVNWALEKVAQQEGGAEFLNDLLTTQIKSIASDYIRPGFIDQLKSWRFMAMLSNPATTAANTGSNFIFGSFMESMANNFALPFDILMSQITGQREVAGELGAFSPTKWKGSAEDGLRSFLEVTLDAETEQASYGYKELKGGTFKMVGNPIERLLATMQKYQGYGLKTTDQMAKGGTRAQVKEGLGRLAEQGKAKAENIAEIAEKNAEYRTLQSKSKIAETTNKVRGAIDEAVHIGNEKTGTFGLGSALMPFAQVPANAVKASINALPVVSAVDALYKTAKTISDAHNGTLQPGQQMEAAKAWGRAANGAVLVAAMAAAAAKGLLRDGSDDDKDVNAQRRAEGTSGTQFNVSAFLRMVSGQGAEPDPDDYWIDFSWCPPINALATFSTDLYDAYARDEDWRDLRNEIPGATYDALTSSFMDFPAVSMISSLINTYKNSDKEGFGKWIETGVTGAAQIASGIAVPNVVRATATGLDPYERDVYNTDTYTQGLWNNLISGIPGARENLPVKLDNFGNPVMNEGGALNFIDRTFIPGSVRQHNKQGEASKVIQGIIEETGDSSIMPNRNAPYKVSFSPGGERVETTAAEREAFKKTAGNIVDEMTQEAAAKGAFENASPEDQRDIIAQFEALAKDRATAEVAKGRGEDYTSTFQELLDGDDDTPALEEENLGDYILFSSLSKNAAKAGKESGDYSDLQSAFGNFFDLDPNTQEVLASRDGDLGRITKLVTGTDNPNINKDIPPLKPENIPEYENFRNILTAKDPDYEAIDKALGDWKNLDPNTQDVLRAKAEGNLRGLRFSRDNFGMHSQTYFKVKNLLAEHQTEELEGDAKGIADAVVISKHFQGSDARKLMALESQNLPASDTGKRSSIVRRFDAAMQGGLSFDKWAQVEAYVSDHSNSSTPSNATLRAAAEACGLKYNTVYQFYKKDSNDPTKINVTNTYFSKRYVAPKKVSHTDYLNR